MVSLLSKYLVNVLKFCGLRLTVAVKSEAQLPDPYPNNKTSLLSILSGTCSNSECSEKKK